MTVLCICFIARKVNAEVISGFHDHIFSFPFLIMITAVVCLMVLNWYLEAWRWKISIPNERISIRDSVRSVLSGLALNWLFPLTLGDAGARLGVLKDKRSSVVALLVNRVLMIAITTIYGAAAVWYYFDNYPIVYLILPVLLLLLILGVILHRFFYGKGFSASRALLLVCGLSLMRYAVFTLQFYLLVVFFFPELSRLVVFLGIGWIYLFKSYIPALFGSLGVREASAFVFFEPFTGNVQLIVFPCLIIWLINNVVPSLVGCYSLIKLKLNIAQ